MRRYNKRSWNRTRNRCKIFIFPCSLAPPRSPISITCLLEGCKKEGGAPCRAHGRLAIHESHCHHRARCFLLHDLGGIPGKHHLILEPGKKLHYDVALAFHKIHRHHQAH